MNMAINPDSLRPVAADLKRDLLVGLTLAVLVIPQAIAFSTALAGLPPYFGIYAAIWGTLFTALLNRSPVFHGGPNSAMSAVIGVTLLPVAPQFGADYIGYALTLIMIAGLIQLLFFLIRPLGRLLDFLSEPVVNGMICGIGLFLIFKSMTGFAGLPVNTEVEWPLWIAWQTFMAVLEIGNLYAIQIGLVTLGTILCARQFSRLRNVSILVGIVVGTLYSEWLNHRYGLENTLVEQTADFSSLGLVYPSLPLFSQEAIPDIIAILPGAVTLALLGLFQTVAAMRRINRQRGTFIDSRNGIFADGVSNALLPLLSSLPTCASFNRMSVMQNMGATSRLAAISSALFLLLMMLFVADWIAIIPIPAMAATIMVVGANMIKWDEIRYHFNNRPEAVVFVASFVSVHLFGLFGAVVTGALLALAYAKWEKAHPRIQLQNNVLRIKGNIYYGSLPVIEGTFHQAARRYSELVLDFSQVHHIDPEGIRWLVSVKDLPEVTLIDRRSGGERRQGGRSRRSDRRREVCL
ncbi:SulP family inorganic anion transporter [Motiliproteus sediminis]|uniref:SulP family inorganic anion transporter n=1 Tax=Motiliproteus sediminis TaxID=1468178 RepID=UPI001FEA2680|nr:solute carrier family 23 protein [Motiliproteus sediminis]